MENLLSYSNKTLPVAIKALCVWLFGFLGLTSGAVGMGMILKRY